MSRRASYYAIRQARSKVIGSEAMSRARAEREAATWAANIGPAAVVPVTPELARAVRAYDQSVLVPLLAAASQGSTKTEGAS
jgi:hypothetical protein